MKVGFRKPSPKRSIKARTTGKIKRKVKRSVNPLYGKKGMGLINNPKKAAYNAVYKRTTFGVQDAAKWVLKPSKKNSTGSASGFGILYRLLFWWWEALKAIGRLISSFASAKSAYIDARDGNDESPQLSDAAEEQERYEATLARRLEEEHRQGKMRRRILKEAGAKVDLLTDEWIVGDARDIVCGPCQIEVRADKEPSKIEVEWQPLTKAGKLPKKIAKACVIWDYSRHDSVICHIGYTAECEPYTADVYLWLDGECEEFKLRMSEGALTIQ